MFKRIITAKARRREVFILFSSFLRSIAVIFLLSACAAPAGINLGHYSDPDATPYDFIYCHGYGCSKELRVGLHEKEWRQIKKILKAPKTAKQERTKIAHAIAQMEKFTGALADTAEDQAFAPIIRRSYQELDCVDETVNTHKYLSFFDAAGLLKFHQVGRPVFKGSLLSGVYPHNSASIIESETGDAYVVDSYIHANGKQPVIRTLKDWRAHSTFESEEL